MPTTYAIPNGATVFAATTYTGNGSTLTVTNGGNNTLGTTFKPDFVWIKDRTGANNHCLFDSVRGVYILLNSNATAADQTFSTSLTSFNSNGFSLGSYGNVNLNSSSNYIAWQWQAGQGTTTTIAAGSISSGVPSIASTVSVNTTAGFSVVTYTGNGSSNQTIGHGLSATPAMIIVKSRTQASANNWRVWHQSLPGSTYYLGLNQTFAQDTSSTVFNGQSDTTFTVGNDPAVNANTYTYVAYCWAEVAGFSKFGSYTGNGSADGVFVYLGFRPRYVMMKNSAISESWYVFDSSRDTYNAMGNGLFPNLSNAETGSYPLDFLSNGFKLRVAGNPNNANTYIYAAFAENPFKYANAR